MAGQPCLAQMRLSLWVHAALEALRRHPGDVCLVRGLSLVNPCALFCTVASYLGWCGIIIGCNPSNELHSAFRDWSGYGVMSVNRKRCVLAHSLEVAVPGGLAWFLQGSGPEEYDVTFRATRKQKERKKVVWSQCHLQGYSSNQLSLLTRP